LRSKLLKPCYHYNGTTSGGGIRYDNILNQYGIWVLIIGLVIYIISIFILTNKIFNYKKKLKSLQVGIITFISMFFIFIPVLINMILFGPVEILLSILFFPMLSFIIFVIPLMLMTFGVMGIAGYNYLINRKKENSGELEPLSN
jgi:hypothetical protein